MCAEKVQSGSNYVLFRISTENSLLARNRLNTRHYSLTLFVEVYNTEGIHTSKIIVLVLLDICQKITFEHKIVKAISLKLIITELSNQSDELPQKSKEGAILITVKTSQILVFSKNTR